MYIKKLGEVSGEALVEEFEKAEYLSRGNVAAEGYLKAKGIDLLAELAHYDTGIRSYVTRGILETLVRNISIPRDSETEHHSRQAIEGILILKENKVSVKKILDDIENCFTDYDGAIQQAYTQLKNEFEIRLDETIRVLEQQLGAKVKYYVERQSQFRKKWRKVRAELNAHYERTLECYKERLQSEI